MIPFLERIRYEGKDTDFNLGPCCLGGTPVGLPDGENQWAIIKMEMEFRREIQASSHD